MILGLANSSSQMFDFFCSMAIFLSRAMGPRWATLRSTCPVARSVSGMLRSCAILAEHFLLLYAYIDTTTSLGFSLITDATLASQATAVNPARIPSTIYPVIGFV
jgi:hypothetical protein